jgi:dihydrofolate reductase
VSASTARPIIVFVVAAAENGVIGRDGDLPWKLKSDMARFKALTINKPVVMGRKTWASLPKPLVHRTNIVATRDKDFVAPGAVVVHSLDEAIAAATRDAQERGADQIAVIGGAEIYRQFMPRADRIELTRVHTPTLGDAVFPDLPANAWRETFREAHLAGPGDEAAFTYLTFERVAA